jgi:hypothetical protein
MWSVIGLILLLTIKMDRSRQILIAAFVVVCNLTHLANISATLVFAVVVSIWALIPKQSFIRLIDAGRVWFVCIASIGAMLVLNASLGAGWQLSKSSHVFLTGKLIETGLMKQFLDASCETQAYKLCAYKDSLPVHASDFLWNDKSPLHQLGGFDSNTVEYKAIIRSIVTQPRYLKPFVQSATVATWEQLQLYAYGEEFIPYRNASDPPYGQVAGRFKQELFQYVSAVQQTTGIDTFQLRKWSFGIFVCSLIGLLMLVIFGMTGQLPLPLMKGWTLLYVFFACNATQAAINTFSARHNSKLNGLFVVFVIIAVGMYLSRLRPGISTNNKTDNNI